MPSQKSGQEHIIDLSLTRLEEQLDPRRFFRANRQVIVCIDAIVHAAPYFNGRIILHVKPIHKDKITVSEEKSILFQDVAELLTPYTVFIPKNYHIFENMFII